MAKLTLFGIGIALAAMAFTSTRSAQAAVFDGGEYSPKKIASHTDFGANDPEPQPANFAFEQDRYSAAPVGKPLYILGNDNKCYWGNFAYNKYEKALIVYYKSPVTTDHCIYQKGSDTKPSGFTISAKMGGVCVPTLGVGDNTATDWKLEEVGSPVAFSWCVDSTISYGDAFPGKAPIRQVAAADSRPVDRGEMAATVNAAVKKDDSTVGGMAAAGSNAPTEEAMGPSVQDASVPWKDGFEYRKAFTTLNNGGTDSIAHSNTSGYVPPGPHPETPDANLDLAAKAKTPANPATATTKEVTRENERFAFSRNVGGHETAAATVPVVATSSVVVKDHGGAFTIQLAAYTTKDDAQHWLDSHKSLHDGWIMEADVNGRMYYRVCVGHYKTAKDAKASKSKVAELTGVKEAFIQKVTERSTASVEE